MKSGIILFFLILFICMDTKYWSSLFSSVEVKNVDIILPREKEVKKKVSEILRIFCPVIVETDKSAI